MRITNFHKFNISQNHMYNINIEMTKRFEQISTGQAFSKASDSPIKLNESMLLQRTQARLEQYESNINDAKNLLSYLDVVFDSSVETIQMAKETAVAGSSETLNADNRKVLAGSIEENIDQLVSFANSKHLDRHVFAGQKTNTEPISYDGQTFVYNGNDKVMNINISNNLSVYVSQSAEEVFTPVLESLVELRDALLNDDSDGIQQAAARLDDAFVAFVDNRSTVGTQLHSVEMMELAYNETKTDLEVKRTQVEGIDMTKVYAEFKQLENLYSASIQSSLNLMRTSVLDFI